MQFKLYSKHKPTGDQPRAIQKLIKGIKKGYQYQTLLGVTGSGKTFTMASVISQIQKPTLVISPNKTLAAQLYSEFKEFFPQNAVCYFVSYYDYYQPEAYIPQTDTYIAKDASINQEIDRLRHASTQALLTRNDVIIVASVSCIYGLGSPKNYEGVKLTVKKNGVVKRKEILKKLTNIYYLRNDINFHQGTFRVRGDTLEVFPAYAEEPIKIGFFGDKIEKISRNNSLTGEILEELDKIDIFPASHYANDQKQLTSSLDQIKEELKQRLKYFKSQGKLLEAERLKQRTNFDLEMIKETSTCSGIENYSRYFDNRAPGQPPFTLLDYFAYPENNSKRDFLLIIDESHIAIPQIRGMFFGDKTRKDTLIEHGFRLPSAYDNRPLNFKEFEKYLNKVIFTSATPEKYELNHSQQIVEQLIRPTGLLDPTIKVKPTKNQVDDLIAEINKRVQKKQRVLVTTLTKRLSEDLAGYLKEMGIKVHYLHSEVNTLKRLEILKSLRLGEYDVVVGINLLREGLDLPEVSLVAILDADKEGYLRSATSLIQTIGRTARHKDGHAIMYADKITSSMKKAIFETQRRRRLQQKYNQKYGIIPESIKKEIKKENIIEKKVEFFSFKAKKLSKDNLEEFIKHLKNQMDLAAKNLDFEKAIELRDQIKALKKSNK